MLQLDPTTDRILYKGKIVGEHSFENGKHFIRLFDLEYSTEDEMWFRPLIQFSVSLRNLPENQPSTPDLTLETPEDCIEKEYDIPRLLIEKIVKRDGYVWAFHKNDVDDWPSKLHGHDYDKGLKLDAITGGIFDASTKKKRADLKSKHLSFIQDELRKSKDFKQKVTDLIGE